MLDFSVRVSSREAYVSPTRGAQGNALKTILAMPFVLDGRHGRVEIEARGLRHVIDVQVDHIEQEPVIGHIAGAVRCKNRHHRAGAVAGFSKLNSGRRGGAFLQIVDGAAWLNPHLTLTLDWFGERIEWAATVDDLGEVEAVGPDLAALVHARPTLSA